MKKSLLTLTAALLASTAAFAADVAHPFYLPEKGGFLSDTNAMYQNYANGGDQDALFTETLSYGVTRRLAVTGTLADIWHLQGRMKKHDNWANPAWGAGVKYNLIDCEKSNLKVQVGADYTQGRMVLTPAMNAGALFDHHLKTLSGSLKVGYQVTDAFIPYVEGSIVKPIGKWEEDPYYTVRGAGYLALTDLISIDAGVDYAHASGKDAYAPTKVFGLDGVVNFKLTDALSLGVTGAYVLDLKPAYADRDYYTVGVNLKAAF